jgi:hypothetical protein
MTVSAFLAALRGGLRGWAPVPFGGRGAWCRKQRRHLSTPGHSVVWVRGEQVPWAVWGARRGYFEVQLMDGLPYLRALREPVR